MELQPGPSVWVDVEDLFEYFRFNPHPSGIQRVALRIMDALLDEAGSSRVRFVRHGAEEGSGLREVRWAEIEAMVQAPPQPEQARPEKARDDDRRSRVQQAIGRLPPELRDPLFRAGVLQSQVGRNLRELLAVVRPPPSRELRAVPTGDTIAQGAAPGAGDLYLVPGAPWSVVGAADLLAGLKRRGARTALLIHDLIPVRRPEWQEPAKVGRFRLWLEQCLPLCDLVLTISGYTARDIEAYAVVRGIPLGGRMRAIPAGTFCPPPALVRPAGLPIPDRYVLFVSTLEFRKNHALAVKVWYKLLDEVRAGVRDASSVPQLVFAGRIGLGVADLLQQLDNSRWLSGRVRLIRDPTDAELRALYEGCLFTLLPSLAEGWGLPVGESLALGKPCLAANSTALPEAGGDLCRYFDPEDVGSAHRAVAALLDEPGAIDAWTDEVRRRFRPRTWQPAAQAILAELAPVPA